MKSRNDMKCQHDRPGDIFVIRLGTELFGYDMVTNSENYAYYDRSDGKVQNKLDHTTSSVLFITAVHGYAIRKGRWDVIGNRPLEESLKKPVQFFRVDHTDPMNYRIYEEGRVRLSNEEDCSGLEPLAVWDPEHIEERLRDHLVVESRGGLRRKL